MSLPYLINDPILAGGRVPVSDPLTLYREYRRILRKTIRDAIKADAEAQNNYNPDVRRDVPNRKTRKVSKALSKARNNTTVSKRRRKAKR